MTVVMYNKEDVNVENIENFVYRSRALIINSKNEILLGHCNGKYEFPGGHVDKGESLVEGLKREVLEETGIELVNESYNPFYVIRYYLKDYKDVKVNTCIEFNYYIIHTDVLYDLDKTNYEDYEIERNYKLVYINLNDVIDIFEYEKQANFNEAQVYRDLIAVITKYIEEN